MSYKSRKFLLTLIGLFIITGVSCLTIPFPNLLAVLPTFVGGILGVLSLYFCGNVANKYVVGKSVSATINGEEGKNGLD